MTPETEHRTQPGTDFLSHFESLNKQLKDYRKQRIKVFLMQMSVYMLRWQLSTPVMTPIILIAHHFGIVNSWACIAWANLFGAIPFYFIDKFIFVRLRAMLQTKLKKVNK